MATTARWGMESILSRFSDGGLYGTGRDGRASLRDSPGEDVAPVAIPAARPGRVSAVPAAGRTSETNNNALHEPDKGKLIMRDFTNGLTRSCFIFILLGRFVTWLTSIKRRSVLLGCRENSRKRGISGYFRVVGRDFPEVCVRIIGVRRT
jgi:hypothetical protein